jgi:DNA-binding winged helix-turn-helix (wHTH) protein
MSGTTCTGYRFGDFLVDTADRRLRRDDLVIPLAGPEFDTLLALIERAGDLVDKHALAMTVWSGRYIDDERVVQSVHTVRKALGAMPDGRFYIEMHPRRGSRFVADVEQLG